MNCHAAPEVSESSWFSRFTRRAAASTSPRLQRAYEGGSIREDASGLGRIAELAKFNAVVQSLAGTPEAQRGDYRATGVVGVLVEIVGEAVRLFFEDRRVPWASPDES